MKKSIKIILILMLTVIMSMTTVFGDTNESTMLETEMSNEDIESGLEFHNQSTDQDYYTYYKNLNVTKFNQGNESTNPYCGPTCVKQLIHYITGSSQSISYYASKLNMDNGAIVWELARLLNNEQSYHTYHYTQATSISNWFYYIEEALDEDCPLIINVKNTSTSSGFPYVTYGHYLTVSGLNLRTNQIVGPYSLESKSVPPTNITKVKITDTWHQGYDNYWYEASVIYDVHQNHTSPYIIY